MINSLNDDQLQKKLHISLGKKLQRKQGFLDCPFNWTCHSLRDFQVLLKLIQKRQKAGLGPLNSA